MGRRRAVCLGTAGALVLLTGCLERPSEQDEQVVTALLTQYLQDRATRLTQAGEKLAGQPLTSVRLSKKFTLRVEKDAAKLDARRRNTRERYSHAEVSLELEDLDLDGEFATAKVHDHTKLFRTQDDGPDTTEFGTDREFTLERVGHGWAVSGQRILGPDMEKSMPNTDFPQ
jgi:hypothetical protein